MLWLLLRRLAGLVLVFLVVTIVTFLMMHAIPGGPFDPGTASKGIPLSSAAEQELLERYGLDKPIPVQYFAWLTRVLRLDFGYCLSGPLETVTARIRRTWPVSIQLGLAAAVAAIAVGIPAGVASALGTRRWITRLTTAYTTVGVSVPSFGLSIVLVLVFAVFLGLLPSGGWGTPSHWILPVLAISVAPTARILRYTRAAMIEQANRDYVRTARGKGLSETSIATGHMLRNSLVPILTVLGPMLADLITGSIYIETIFRIPGLGRYFTESLLARDYNMIMGVTLLWVTCIGVANLVVDVLYRVVDPRISSGERGTL